VGNAHSRFSENLKEVMDHLEDPGVQVDRRIIFKWILNNNVGGLWSRSIWLWLGTNGWLLWKR
jgi:hypothetical protein